MYFIQNNYHFKKKKRGPGVYIKRVGSPTANNTSDNDIMYLPPVVYVRVVKLEFYLSTLCSVSF